MIVAFCSCGCLKKAYVHFTGTWQSLLFLCLKCCIRLKIPIKLTSSYNDIWKDTIMPAKGIEARYRVPRKARPEGFAHISIKIQVSGTRNYDN
jgi:hypothetical protein